MNTMVDKTLRQLTRCDDEYLAALAASALRDIDEFRRCRVCGCSDRDCRECIARTGRPCHWVSPDLCSACQSPEMARGDRELAAAIAADPRGFLAWLEANL